MPRIYARRPTTLLHTTRITIPMTQAQRDALDRAARESAETPTQWARRVLAEAL